MVIRIGFAKGTPYLSIIGGKKWFCHLRFGFMKIRAVTNSWTVAAVTVLSVTGAASLALQARPKAAAVPRSIPPERLLRALPV